MQIIVSNLSVKISSPLKGKIALVTGASSGIGYEIAKTLARAGVCTIGAARNLEKLRSLEDELKAENIENFLPMQMDITNKDDVRIFRLVAY